MSLSFAHDTLGQRVILQSGAAAPHLAEEVRRLDAARVMVIAGGHEAAFADRLAADLPVALRWDEVTQHVPVELAERARAAAAEKNVDLLVCIGGGSTVGLAKAIALTGGQPILAVPTTYAGSEATRMWGMTQDREKKTGLDDRVLPTTVVYDSELTLTLPVDLSVASGLNGIAHCVDSLWAPGADPINQTLALAGVRGLREGLTRVVADPEDIDGRDQCLYGAYLSAVSFASAGSGMHHKICHTLGGTFNLPHAETHATVLAYVLAYNAPAVPELAGRLAEALGVRPEAGADPAAAAVDAFEDFRRTVNAPRALRDLGLAEDDLDEAAERVLKVVPESNPRPVTTESIQSLLRAAWAGDDPRSLT